MRTNNMPAGLRGRAINEGENMRRTNTNNFTDEEKEIMDTIATNYILAQSDGFQLGYAQAISDFADYIIDYWEGSDDKPQQSILNLLVDLGVELGERKEVARKNVEKAKEMGYEQYYNWEYRATDSPFGITVRLYTKADSTDMRE